MDIAAVISLAFVASITPGPNNLMLWASGMNHGVRRTLRHLAGVSLGFNFLVFVVALGLGNAFERFPSVEVILKLAGGAYLLYLAYKVFTTANIATDTESAAPLTFIQAALFQWVNPKAWVMATTATAAGLDPNTSLLVGAMKLTVLFGVVNLPCIVTWMLSGAFAARFIENEGTMRRINQVLGVMLAGTVVLLVA